MQRWPGVPSGLFILLTHAQMHYGCMYLLDAVASSNISVSRSYGNDPDPRVRHIFSCKWGLSLADSRRAKYHLMAKECELNIGNW